MVATIVCGAGEGCGRCYEVTTDVSLLVESGQVAQEWFSWMTH